MELPIRAPAKWLLGAAVFTTTLVVDVDSGLTGGVSFAAPAEARIGRPLTPLSYAGVARRTTYRAVARSAATPVVVAPVPVVVVPPTCVDTVNAYGVVTRVCR